MIHPSYVDLMQAVNSQVEEGEEPVISSRYSIVMATARRARQLIAGDEALVRAKGSTKPLSIAVEELNQQEVKILTEADKEEMRRRIAEELELESGDAADHDSDADADTEAEADAQEDGEEEEDEEDEA
ncbi:MAG: DNA-directed RNA polymerase subunit omega [Lachnospiraceae bacterium]|nr:DNA-directed RNA polymerase subunit omega [Lachnospiraceae bacterium]